MCHVLTDDYSSVQVFTTMHHAKADYFPPRAKYQLVSQLVVVRHRYNIIIALYLSNFLV